MSINPSQLPCEAFKHLLLVINRTSLPSDICKHVREFWSWRKCTKYNNNVKRLFPRGDKGRRVNPLINIECNHRFLLRVIFVYLFIHFVDIYWLRHFSSLITQLNKMGLDFVWTLFLMFLYYHCILYIVFPSVLFLFYGFHLIMMQLSPFPFNNLFYPLLLRGLHFEFLFILSPLFRI